MTRYQMFLAAVLVLWPLMITGLLFLMSKLELFVARLDAGTPQEAGLEPVSGEAPDREVRIFLGDQVVGAPD